MNEILLGEYNALQARYLEVLTKELQLKEITMFQYNILLGIINKSKFENVEEEIYFLMKQKEITGED